MSNLFKSKSQQTSSTSYDPRVYGESLQNLQLAEQVAAIPFQQYRGPMVAPFTRDYMTGEQMTRGIASQGGFVPEVEQASRATQAALGFQPASVQAGQVQTQFAPERVQAGQTGTEFTSRDVGAALQGGPQQVQAQQIGTQFQSRDVGASLQGGPQQVQAGQIGTQFQAPTARAAQFTDASLGQYMDPYQRDVIDVGLSDISRQDELARQQRQQRAASARAFGGSRAAIQEGIAAGEAARERNRFIAEQRSRGFQQAAQLREADVGRAQQAELANQAARQQAQQMGMTAEQFNVGQGMQAQLANQQARERFMQMGLSAEQANQAANLQTQQMGLTASQANQQAAMQAGLANQQARQQFMQMGLSAEQANQAANLQTQQMRQQAQQFNVGQGMQAQLANQQAAQQAAQMGLTAQQFNAQQAMQAGLANQQAGLQGAQFRVGAAQQLAGLGQQALQNRYGAAQAMMGIGSAQQQLAQQLMNAQQQEFQRRINYPLQQLAIRQGAVAAAPINQQTSSTGTQRGSYAQIAGQVASFATPFLPSDERMKKNIKKIKNPLDKVGRLKGVEFEWEDEYGGDEDSSIIAQDAEKVMPGSTRKRPDGMMEYDTSKMIGLLTEAVKELDAKVGKAKGKKA